MAGRQDTLEPHLQDGRQHQIGLFSPFMNRGLYFWIKAFVIAIVLVLIIKTFAFTSCTIPFSGMENSLYQGDRIIVNKWSYGLRTPFISLFSYHRWGETGIQRDDIVVFNNPQPRDRQTAIDDREVFISRCIGLPGDTLMLTSRLGITSHAVLNPDYKSLYSYPREKEDTLLQAIKQLGIRNNELIGFTESSFIRSFSHYEIYLLKQESGNTIAFTPLQTKDDSNIHPFVIPKKGSSVRVYPWNARLLCNTITQHEGKKAEVRGDTLFVDGHKAFSYLFSKDYYWMVSNNSINMNDSRLFGFVPKDHIIGKASFIWFSKDPEAGMTDGYRWNRFFHTVK